MGNPHVFTVGAAEIDEMLLFGDRLRADDADRGACLRVKATWQSVPWQHVQYYADSKAASSSRSWHICELG